LFGLTAGAGSFVVDMVGLLLVGSVATLSRCARPLQARR